MSGLLVQLASGDAGSWTTVFAGYLIGGLFVFPIVLFRRGATAFTSENFIWLIARGGVGVAQIALFFHALASISLLEAMLLRETAPLWALILSWIFLGGSMPRNVWLIVLTGFAGVALVLHPNLVALNYGYLFGLAAGILLAIQILLTKHLNQLGEPQDRVLLYIYVLGFLGTLVPAAGTYVTLDFVTIEQLVFAGLSLLGSGILFVVAMGHTPVWMAASLHYATIVFSAVLDWLVMGRIPNPVSTAGIVLVVVSGILTIHFAPKNRSS